jgi:general secretion pathway protein G
MDRNDKGALRRGDTVRAVRFAGRRVFLSKKMRYAVKTQRGFSLIELVITITVMTILTLGIIPLVKVSVKRQKEQQLRDVLRQMRTAVDEFHRDTVGMICQGIGAGVPQAGQQQQQNVFIDPRSKVVISDCTIFGVDNPDRYPPDLETLINGVNVLPRTPNQGGGGLQGSSGRPISSDSTLDQQTATKKKVYLRAIPIDPMTGDTDWDFRSCYDAADSSSWGGENVFDVRSKSKETALNGEKYSDW